MTDAPTSIRIGYRDYRVEWMTNEHASLLARFAEIDHNTAVMRVQENLDSPKMVNSILHEILHGCWFISGLSQKKPKEEQVVSCVANQLTQVWRDNPDLVKWISEQLQPGEPQ